MSKLLNFLKFLLLIVACFGAAFIIVWPLWKFATKAPQVYTVVVLVSIALLIIVKIVRQIVKHVKK